MANGSSEPTCECEDGVILLLSAAALCRCGLLDSLPLPLLLRMPEVHMLCRGCSCCVGTAADR